MDVPLMNVELEQRAPVTRGTYALLSSGGNGSETAGGALAESANASATQPAGSAAGAAPLAGPPQCRICGETEGELLSLCACSGSVAHIHLACLERWIETRPVADHENGGDEGGRDGAQDRGADTQERRMICELCHTRYRVVAEYVFRFSWSTCMRGPSVAHFCELIMIFLMFIMLVVLWPTLRARQDNQNQQDSNGQGANGANGQGSHIFGSSEADNIFLPIILSVLGVFTLMTMRVIYRRWRRANSELVLVPRDDPEEAQVPV